MAQSVDEKRGYQRGYNRAIARSWDRVRRVIKVARGYKAQIGAVSHDKTCMTCARWIRGGGMNNSAGCLWGTCRADFEYGLEERMWIDMPVGVPRSVCEQVTITTTERFGCNSWLPHG